MRPDGEPLVTLPPPEAAGPQGCQTSELSPAAGAQGRGSYGQGVEWDPERWKLPAAVLEIDTD